MGRKAKILGLALVAVLAMSAVASAAANAAEYKAPAANLALHGEQVTKNVFTVTNGPLKCSRATFAGMTTATAAKEQKIEPTYGECTAFGSSATVEMNGCWYQFHQPTGSGPWTATVGVECPAGRQIEIKLPLSNCAIIVEGGQTPGGSVKLENVGSISSILATAALTGIKYHAAGPGTACGAVGVNETNGGYTGSVELHGWETTSHAGTQKGISVG